MMPNIDTNKPCIIFLNTGNPNHLRIALQQAKLFNENLDVILLGDASNNKYEGIIHYEIKDYFKAAEEFKNKYYTHMSNNSYEFELICYQRWFVIHEFIKEKGYTFFCYMDSDVILKIDLLKYLNTIPKEPFYLIGHNNVDESTFNPSLNFFRADTIADATAFMKESYIDNKLLQELKDKWKHHVDNDILGGVCDMTQLKMFFDNEAKSNSKIYDIYDIYNNKFVPDGNVNFNTNYYKEVIEYKMHLGIKLIKIKDHKAFAYLKNGKEIPLISSHFQGRAKKLMKYYAQKNFNPLKPSNTIRIIYTWTILRFAKNPLLWRIYKSIRG